MHGAFHIDLDLDSDLSLDGQWSEPEESGIRRRSGPSPSEVPDLTDHVRELPPPVPAAARVARVPAIDRVDFEGVLRRFEIPLPPPPTKDQAIPSLPPSLRPPAWYRAPEPVDPTLAVLSTLSATAAAVGLLTLLS